MAKKVNKAEVKEEQLAQLQSLEVSMLNKDKFTDDELDAYLDKGEIKAAHLQKPVFSQISLRV